MRRTQTSHRRLEARRACSDRRAWVVKRRERTRHLIELGGLIAKAGLIELVDDDRAVIFGILTEAAAILRTERRELVIQLWQRRGRRSFARSDDASG